MRFEPARRATTLQTRRERLFGCAVVISSCLSWAATVSAQPENAAVPTHSAVKANLEPSYIAVPLPISGLDPVWFESSVLAHFFVHRSAWPLAIVLTPEILVRMFREHSQPVKTPSYLPRLAVFAWLAPTLYEREPTAYASLTIGHHSNGQTGPFFREDGRINHDDGDFYTNYVELAAHAVYFRCRLFGWSRLALQWHPGFVQKPELHERYGSLRLNAAATVLERLPLRGRLSAQLGVILDDFLRASDHPLVRALERFPVAVEFSISIPDIDLGVYASYYFGHDYYNIWFDRLLHTFQLGISGSVAPTLGPER